MAVLSKKTRIMRKRARNQIDYKIRTGKIKKPDCCSRCGKRTSVLEAHHTGGDYNSKTGGSHITWLCKKCHTKITGKYQRKINRRGKSKD